MDHNTIIILIVLFGCLFSYTNGFQDGSSVAASPIASRSIPPAWAALLSGIFEFLGALLGGQAVAGSIVGITRYGGTKLDERFLPILLTALVAAISWNFFTRAIKVPSSSTHALVGGLIGALYAASGNFDYIVVGELGYFLHPTGVTKVIVTLFLSPLIGFLAGFILLKLVYVFGVFFTASLTRLFKRLQWLALPLLAFGHGANDSQKVMGLIAFSLLGNISTIPIEIRLLIAIALTTGVLAMAPGIVKRVGTGIYRLRPTPAFVAQLASAVVVTMGSLTGGPLSASQVIASTVMGVGCAERRKGVHWLVARDMLMAWVLTIPSSAFLAYWLYRLF